MLAPALLAGCATAPVPPAALSYDGHHCDGTPDLGRAASLAPEDGRAIHTVTTPVDGFAPCLGSGASATPYLLYAIPPIDVRMIEVGSHLEPARIFSLKVDLLDEGGNRVRSFAPEHYLYRGGILSVQFVPQSGERFILVTADPARIGQTRDAVAISTSTTAVWTGYGAATWTSGVDQNISRTFSYEGSVMAAVYSPDDRDR